MKFGRYLLAVIALVTSWLASGQASPFPTASQPPKESGQRTDSQTGRLVHDVTTGRYYREQLVNVSVPVTAWETKPVTQTVYERKLVTSYVPTQQVVYTPRTTYQWQPQLRGRFNPFRQTVVTYSLRPYTTWQPNTIAQSTSIVSQQWVPSQQTSYVAQPVQRTETRQQITYREASPGKADVTIASAPVRYAASPEPLIQFPILGRGRVFPNIGNGQMLARASNAINASVGLRPVTANSMARTIQTANYQAPLHTAARSPSATREPLQAGLNATVLR